MPTSTISHKCTVGRVKNHRRTKEGSIDFKKTITPHHRELK